MQPSDGVFLVTNGSLLEMPVFPWDAEVELQDLLETHPDLLAGSLIDTDEPRRWLLVRREQGVPAAEGGPNVWSVDHLFLDQDAIPTIVEVKRSSNTQIRRQVVGQMLDYAANGVRYWPPDRLRADVTARLDGESGMARELARLLDRPEVDDAAVESFWRKVRDNLRAGRLRLLFVADEIPATLQRIIEFLNEQMTQTEVLGLAIQQYANGGTKVLIPRIYGRTAEARAAKGQDPAPGYAEYLEEASDVVRTVVRRLEGLAESHGWPLTTSRAARQARDGDGSAFFQIYPHWGTVEFYLGGIQDAGMAQEHATLRSALAELAGRDLPNRHPSVMLERLNDQWESFDKWLRDYVAACSAARAGRAGS